MATIFLSYRRTDSPQACRVYDWLVQRFGKDAVFMDVAAIPFAVRFPDFIRNAIAGSNIMIALIGSGWPDRIQAADDPVRAEIEAAFDHHVPVLPVLIGNTAMPDPADLPASISTLASQNAVTVGVSNDFHTHMQALLPRIESILGAMAMQSAVTADPDVIHLACHGIITYLRETYSRNEGEGWFVEWDVVGTGDFAKRNQNYVTLFMHRVVRFDQLLELHFILSFWGIAAAAEHKLSGWVLRQLERTPVIPGEFFDPGPGAVGCNLKIRPSDEDSRQIWQMITDEPLRLSLAYVAVVSPQTP
jgi:TIR domain/Pvc16 N-terminal domain